MTDRKEFEAAVAATGWDLTEKDKTILWNGYMLARSIPSPPEPQQAQGEQVVAWMKADGSDAVTAEKKKTMLENLGFGGKQLAELYSIALIPADQSGSAPVADSATTGPAALSRLASK